MCVDVVHAIAEFYSHVNYSVTKIDLTLQSIQFGFYSHVNYSVTKMNVH